MGVRPGAASRPRRRPGLNGVLFVRHATSAGMREARFPAGDPAEDPADAGGLARARLLAGTLPGAEAWSSPSRAALETCAALGLDARPVAALAEADHGRWAGQPYARVAADEPEALACWLSDPHAVPHGGESRAAFAARVAAWLGTGVSGVAVCDAGVIRAALAHAVGLDVTAADRIDLAPLSTTALTTTALATTGLTTTGDGWRVAHVNRKVLV
ncbi:histidine phosphatase family protein [Actinomadura sp. 3N407]|uniref:histidine phosphatase family protein n=1 Tax=Actinomadura sp. 3N407 TaxID=3457423 RepID=UPI003FCC98DB